MIIRNILGAIEAIENNQEEMEIAINPGNALPTDIAIKTTAEYSRGIFRLFSTDFFILYRVYASYYVKTLKDGG